MKLGILLILIPLAACAPEQNTPPTCEQVQQITGEKCPSDTIRELEVQLVSLREVLAVQIRTLNAAIDREGERRNEILMILKESYRDRDLARAMLLTYSENIATLFDVVEDISRQIQEIDSYLKELKNVQ